VTSASTNQNTTVESLLLSLDKIEKESNEFLKVNADSNKAIASSLSTTSTVTFESDTKVNSILSFLDDEGLKDTATSFVPKPFKDYTIDLRDYEEVQDVKQARRASVASIGSKTSASSKTAVKSRNSSQVGSNLGDASSRSTVSSKKSAVKTPPAQSIGKQAVRKQEDKLEKKGSIESLEETISHEIELTDKIMEQKMELADKTRQIAMLEKALVKMTKINLDSNNFVDFTIEMPKLKKIKTEIKKIFFLLKN